MEKITLFDRATTALRRFYGYNSFRPGQFEAIEAAMNGRDSLVIMPTGGGKSMCFQIPTLLNSDGVTIVVSPLIALMNDQVEALQANGIPAATIHSSMSDAEARDVMDAINHGLVKLIYVSPERVLNDAPHWAKALNIKLIAIDEAHCISQWGHDFRPVYTRLSELKTLMPDVPIMALTATADESTRNDIAIQLRLTNPLRVINSFDRPNISLAAMLNPGKTRRLAIISEMIERHAEDSGIVYCLSRKGTEETAGELKRRGFRVEAYHAGMGAREREQVQRQFSSGELQAICATVAFGMGIDKSNIRWVIHNNLPANIESYYQEIGRAGRDGAPAEALMFYSYADVATRSSFLEESGRPQIDRLKLERMMEYAQAGVCRRRILLNYFDEPAETDCHNCDVCHTPPKRIDGTVIAWKALSAVIRTEGTCGMNMLIDILRGHAARDVMARGFHNIKTFGAGRDLSVLQWRHYISQLIQLGLLKIAYDNHNHLKVTELGRSRLRDRTTIELAEFQPREKASKRVKESNVPVAATPDDQLMSRLKQLRRRIAAEEGVRPYMVLSDKVLMGIVAALPMSIDRFALLEGIGEVRLLKYGRRFVEEVIGGPIKSGDSERVTEQMWNRGLDVEKIALRRGLSSAIIYNHIVTLINEGRISDGYRAVPQKTFTTIMRAYEADTKNYVNTLRLRNIPYGQIMVAIALSKKIR